MTGSPFWKLVAVFIAGTFFGVVASVQVFPHASQPTAYQTTGAVDPRFGDNSDPGSVSGGRSRVGNQQRAAAAFPGAQAPPPGLACAGGRNGGPTDVGVTGDSIKLATTVVRSGIGAAFLGDVQFAMEAIRNKANREGGICGRRIEIKYVDDGWQAQRGADYLRNFIDDPKDKIFAIPVGPSSEGLRLVIDSGDIDQARIPVVGTDGMLIDQYTHPWVWPVAVSTASTARLMVRRAYDMGIRDFSIVFDKNYRFGAESAKAFNNEVKLLTHNNVPGYNSDNNCAQRYCGIQAGQSSYTGEVRTFSGSADRGLVAMFLEPATALTWMATTGAPTANSSRVLWGAQPLFTRDFAVNCQRACDQMWVWTGYKPPIEDYANDSIVRAYVTELKRTKPDADEFNAFAEGGYVGMKLLVDALQLVGPYLTRDRLRVVLDGLKFQSGLTLQNTVSWGAGNHFANSTMQAFAIQYRDTFGGWRAEAIAKDPNPQLGTG